MERRSSLPREEERLTDREKRLTGNQKVPYNEQETKRFPNGINEGPLGGTQRRQEKPTMENQASNALPAIRQTLVLNAPIEKVWQAVSTPEGMAAWFMPSDMEPVVGRKFHLEAGPFGKSPCEVTEVDPPRRLSFRWGRDWTLSFELKELEGKTEFTLEHSGWDADKLTEFGQPHPAVRENMAKGWSGIVQKLAGYVEG